MAKENWIKRGRLGQLMVNGLLKIISLFWPTPVLRINYYHGFNFNFSITEAQARSLLPSNLRPIELKICASENEPKYYLSLYLASVEAISSSSKSDRVDVFTYCRDENDEYGLFFISAIMTLPKGIKPNSRGMRNFNWLCDFFARDTKSDKPSYPHGIAPKISISSTHLDFNYLHCSIRSDSIKTVGASDMWDREFVLANSQIYRNSHDKNINHFNQRFINARVSQIDPSSIEFNEISAIHPLCQAVESIQYYGSSELPSSWYIEL